MYAISRSEVDSLLDFKSFFFLDGCGKLLSFWGSGRRGGKGHLPRTSGLALKQFGAVVGLVGFEHAMESVEELAPDGDQRLHFEFATLEQMLVESAQAGGRGGASVTMSFCFHGI